ncbi:MAG: hypothetical protein L0177_05360, partial [Chloroflexi bacterium]|nr:hypothetical protein [Chloroflexota bacterium]
MMLAGALLAAVATIATYVYIAYKGRLHASTQAQFFFAGWSLNRRDVGETVFSSSMSLASVVVALIQLTAVLGPGILFAAITFSLGWGLFAQAAPAILSRHPSIHTLHHFLERTYGSTLLRRTASAATAVGLVGLFATELFAVNVLVASIGMAQSSVTPIVAIFGLLACVHAAEGGFRSVVGTDRLQNRLLLLSVATLLVLAVMGWMRGGAPDPIDIARQRGLGLSLSLGLGLFLINVPYPWVDATAWQRLIASRDAATFRSGTRWAAAGFLLSWSAVIVIGLLALSFTAPNADPFASALGQALSLSLPLQFIAAVLIFPGFIAAMLSSADAFLNGAAH